MIFHCLEGGILRSGGAAWLGSVIAATLALLHSTPAEPARSSTKSRPASQRHQHLARWPAVSLLIPPLWRMAKTVKINMHICDATVNNFCKVQVWYRCRRFITMFSPDNFFTIKVPGQIIGKLGTPKLRVHAAWRARNARRALKYTGTICSVSCGAAAATRTASGEILPTGHHHTSSHLHLTPPAGQINFEALLSADYKWSPYILILRPYTRAFSKILTQPRNGGNFSPAI